MSLADDLRHVGRILMTVWADEHGAEVKTIRRTLALVELVEQMPQPAVYSSGEGTNSYEDPSLVEWATKVREAVK
jgi:hypothetical protein